MLRRRTISARIKYDLSHTIFISVSRLYMIPIRVPGGGVPFKWRSSASVILSRHRAISGITATRSTGHVGELHRSSPNRIPVSRPRLPSRPRPTRLCLSAWPPSPSAGCTGAKCRGRRRFFRSRLFTECQGQARRNRRRRLE